LPHVYVYGRFGKFVWFWAKSSVTRTLLSGRFFQNARIPRLEGLNVTIRELIEEQRRRMNSANASERLAAALLIPGELTKRLDKLDDHEIGQLLDDEVGAKLNLFGPESTVCDAAVTRLRRRVKGLPERNSRNGRPIQLIKEQPSE
jgi:hypothetical protein